MCAKKQTMWGAHSLLGRCLALPFHSFPGIGSMSVPAKGDSCLSGSMYFEWLKLTASGALKLLWDKVHVLAWGHVCSVGPWSWGPWLSLIGPLQGGDHVSHELGPCSELSRLAQAVLPDSFPHFHSSASGWDPWVQDFREGFMRRETKHSKISALSQWCPRRTLTLKFCNQDPSTGSSPAPPGLPDETTQATQIT